MTETAINIHRRPLSGDRTMAETKLHEYIERGRTGARAVVDQVLSQVPVDRLVRSDRVGFMVGDSSGEVTLMATGGLHETMHRNALQQVAGRLEIPSPYVDDLNGSPWGRELLATNFNTLMARRHEAAPKQYLTRSVNGQVRGFMSDRYRRMDSRPILAALMESLKENGALVSDGYAGDTRVHLKAILPQIVTPYEGEFLLFGMEWRNSDFGRGANELSAFVLRLVCLNGLVASTEMRKVHLGARLTEDINYTEETHQLDTQATASAMKDLTKHLLGPARVETLSDMIRQANETNLDPKAAVAALRRDMTKTETARVTELFNSPDVVNLPPGNTTWRLSNAVSYLAHEVEDMDRRMELERIAGKVAVAA